MSPIRYFLATFSGLAFVFFSVYEWRYDNSIINSIVSLSEIHVIFGAIGGGFLVLCGSGLCLIFFKLFDMITKK